jgi:hypothetical protein
MQAKIDAINKRLNKLRPAAQSDRPSFICIDPLPPTEPDGYQVFRTMEDALTRWGPLVVSSVKGYTATSPADWPD